MKSILLSFFLILSGSIAFAQVAIDSTAAKKDSVVLSRNPARDRFIFDLHWDGWLDAPDSMDIKGFSSGVGFHFFYDVPFGKPSTEKAGASFAIGIGYSASNYYNKSFFSYDTTTNITSVNPYSADITIKKDKFVVNYLEVPLEFRFHTKENKGNSFKIAIGFKGGYVFSNHTKYVGEDPQQISDDDIKVKVYRIPNVNKLQYGPTFRIGYGNVNLQAYYGLNTIFEDGFGPSGQPITVGISFNPF